MDIRKQALEHWFRKVAAEGLEPESESDGEISPLQAVTGDASFRRYFRAAVGPQSYILMDAPPEQESCAPFVAVAGKYLKAGLNVPKVFAADLQQGFLCLSDLGEVLYWEKLQAAQQNTGAEPGADRLYLEAFRSLLKIQQCRGDSAYQFPLYDDALLMREMALFRHWFCEGLLGLTLSPAEQGFLDLLFENLRAAAQAQIQVCVHRDYHSRNLLYLPGQAPGILDFQDAVWGAVTYDLVSLLKDAYLAWPRQQVKDWALVYGNMAVREGILPELDEAGFLRDFDLMGMQRHLKVVGIFARLNLRDGKSRYLADIPRVLHYITEVAEDYDVLAGFGPWLQERIMPCLAKAVPEEALS